MAQIGSRIYDDALYDTDRPVASLWEDTAGTAPADDGPLDADASTEVAVIGGGIAGLSLVWHLTQRHGIAATAVDAGKIGWGASGRNGGFVSLGYTKRSQAELSNSYGSDDARVVFQAQKAACAYVIDTVESTDLDVELTGRGEYIVAHKPDRMKELAARSEAMRNLFGEVWPVLSTGGLAAAGYRSPEAHGGIHVPHGTGLHPLKYTYGLLSLARRYGGRVHPHSMVTRWERSRGGHILHTSSGGILSARRVVVATNGFTTEGLDQRFDDVTLPALSNILVTRRLSEEERREQGYSTTVPVADSRNLLFYIRLLSDGRLLFARSWWHKRHRRVGQTLLELYAAAAWRGPSQPGRTSPSPIVGEGLVCLTADLVGRVGLFPDDPSTGYLFGCHGSGVAMSGYAAKFLAAELAGTRFNEPFPMCFRQPPKRFVLPSLRVPALAAAYAWYRFKDEVLPA